MQQKIKTLSKILIFILISAVFYSPNSPVFKTSTVFAAAITANPGTSAGAAVSPCTNSENWTGTGTPGNASANDSSYIALADSNNNFDNNEISDQLRLTNFGLSIPDGSSIDGIAVEVLRWSTQGGIEDHTIRLTKDGSTAVGDNKALSAATNWPTSDPGSAYQAYGAAADSWGTTWSEAEVEASAFGVIICAIADGQNSRARIDHVQITVYYSPPVTGITVSGNVYSDEGSTGLSNSRTISLSVNGAVSVSTTTVANTGQFDFFNVNIAGAGDAVTVFLDNAAEDAATVTRALSATDNITGLNLYQDRVIVRHEDPGPITIANLNQYDSEQDSDIPFTATTSPSTSLTINDLTKLIVWTGKTFTPGGSIATSPSGGASSADGDLAVQSGATLSLGANALSIGGDFANAGTFSISTGQTTTFTATGTGFTFDVGASGSFENLTFNGSGGNWAASSTPLTINSSLTITAGTLNLNFSDPTTTVAGLLTNNGTLQASNINQLTFRNDWVNTGTFTNNGGTVAASPVGTSVNISGMNNAAAAFYNFTANAPGKSLRFKEGESTVFTGSASILGAQGSPVEIRSQTDNQQWLLDLQGSMVVDQSNVKDSGCAAATVSPSLALRVFNQGNNGGCWGFIKRGKVKDPVDGGEGGGTPTTGGEPGGGGTLPGDGGSGGGDGAGGGGSGGGDGGSP